jgi:hypothetical protein
MLISSIARIGALLAVTLSLAACNSVISGQPIFTDADRANAPLMQPGIWVSQGCTVELTHQHATVCAIRYEVTAQTIRFILDDQAFAHADAPSAPDAAALSQAQVQTDTRFPYLVAAGNPPIVQVAPAGDGDTYFFFYAIEPVATGADGRVVEINMWPVLCGPPAKPESEAELARKRKDDSWYVSPPTDKPFPGIEVSGGGCSATDRDAVITAARASRTIENKSIPPNKPGGERLRWIAAAAP